MTLEAIPQAGDVDQSVQGRKEGIRKKERKKGSSEGCDSQGQLLEGTEEEMRGREGRVTLRG